MDVGEINGSCGGQRNNWCRNELTMVARNGKGEDLGRITRRLHNMRVKTSRTIGLPCLLRPQASDSSCKFKDPFTRSG